MRTMHWILDASGTPLIENDPIAWEQWFQTAERHVEETPIGGKVVSTVFLGLDHNFDATGPPILWETMVFPEADICERYSTLADAKAGHQRICDALRSAPA